MTPLEIQIALIYHCTAHDFRDGDFSAPAVREAIDWFVDIGFLRLNAPGLSASNAIYIPMERLHAYCKKLCSIGLPKPTWTYDEN